MAQLREMVRSLEPRRATAEAKYLYCIIKCDRKGSFNSVEGIGGRGYRVHTVVFGDLAAVVSDSPDIKYETTRANMMAHQTVIERVMSEGFTVLPVRFGTVTRTGTTTPVEDIRHKLLERKSAEIEELYRQMDGRVELGVRALWRDEKAIFEGLVAESRAIRTARDALLRRTSLPAEKARFDRMRLGEMVKAALDRKREKEAKNLLARLAPLAERVRENRIVVDRMVLNAAFLVHENNEAAFDEAMAALNEELAERMALKYIGPTPPFNFCEIVVTWDEE
jgi:hypothetical protein